jgi:hypothetical protein
VVRKKPLLARLEKLILGIRWVGLLYICKIRDTELRIVLLCIYIDIDRIPSFEGCYGYGG